MTQAQRKWTDEEKQLLRQLWESGAHRNEIGERLGVRPDVAAHMASHLKFRRNPRPIRWASVRMDFQIITYVHMGVTREEIARRLGIRKTTVSSRIQNIHRRAQRKGERKTEWRPALSRPKPEKDTSAKRKCLSCLLEFDSTHAGNRLCAPCKQRDGYDISAAYELRL